MIEILLVIVIILLIVNIYISVKPQGVDMGPVKIDMEQKVIQLNFKMKKSQNVQNQQKKT